MNEHPLLKENEGKRLTLRLPLLVCFAMFSAWQMGMVYFSGQTLSVDGRTPLPVNIGDYTVVITAGYALSILVMLLLPRAVVWAERAASVTALLAALALFLRTTPEVLAAALHVQFSCCCLMIGFETALIVGLFTERTAVLHLTAAYGVANGLVALLQNDFFTVEFSVFRLFSVVALAMMVFFFCKIPGNVWPRSVKKADGLAMPKQMFAGLLLWACMSCFLILFGNAVAEKTAHGVSVLYLSAAAGGLVIYWLWKRGVMPFQGFLIFIAMGALGFVLAIASLYVPALSLVTCVFLGAGSIGCWWGPLFGLLVAKQYPSRFISPALIGVAFLAVLAHSALLDVFREDTLGMYIVYLVIAVTLVILFLILEPYLLYSFRGRSLREVMETPREPAAPAPGGSPAPAPAQAQAAESEIRQKLKQTAISPLTPREYEVAELTIIGVKRQIIADRLDIQPSTVDSHRNSVYNKFGVRNRDELLRRVERLSRELPDGKKES